MLNFRKEDRQNYGEVLVCFVLFFDCLIFTIKIWNQYFTLVNDIYKMFCPVWIYPQLIFYMNKASLRNQSGLPFVS